MYLENILTTHRFHASADKQDKGLLLARTRNLRSQCPAQAAGKRILQIPNLPHMQFGCKTERRVTVSSAGKDEYGPLLRETATSKMDTSLNIKLLAASPQYTVEIENTTDYSFDNVHFAWLDGMNKVTALEDRPLPPQTTVTLQFGPCSIVSAYSFQIYYNGSGIFDPVALVPKNNAKYKVSECFDRIYLGVDGIN